MDEENVMGVSDEKGDRDSQGRNGFKKGSGVDREKSKNDASQHWTPASLAKIEFFSRFEILSSICFSDESW